MMPAPELLARASELRSVRRTNPPLAAGLPSVWTNVYAGMALAGAALDSWYWLPLAAAMSVLYTGAWALAADVAEDPAAPRGTAEAARARRFSKAGYAGIFLSFVGMLGMYWRHLFSTPRPCAVAALGVAVAVAGRVPRLATAAQCLLRMVFYLVGGVMAREPDPQLALGPVLVVLQLVGTGWLARGTTLETTTGWHPRWLAVLLVPAGVLALQGLAQGRAVPWIAVYLASGIALTAAGRRRTSSETSGRWRAALPAASLCLLDGVHVALLGYDRQAALCVGLGVLSFAMGWRAATGRPTVVSGDRAT